MERPRDGGVAHVATSDLAIRYLLANQLRAFVRAGYRVDAVSAPGAFRDELAREPFGYVSVPMARRILPPHDAAAFARLVRLFRRRRYALVHTHTNKAGILGCWAARAAGVPRVATTVHGFYFHEHMHPALRRAFVDLYRATFRLVDRVFLQSREDVETAIAERIAPPSRLVHIGNGIDLGRFDPDDDAVRRRGARLRASVGASRDDVLVGIVARLNPEKGVSELLHAAAAVRAGRAGPPCPALRVVVVGDGPSRARFEALARDLGIADAVSFVGLSAEVPAWLSALDVYALPSYREGFPRSLCEAFAMGRACVATRIRGCREIVRDGETGLLVERADADDLARALARLCADPAMRAAFGAAARAHARRHFDENRVIERIAAAYDDLGVRPADAPGREKGVSTWNPRR